MLPTLATWTCALALTLAGGSPQEGTAEDPSSQTQPGLGLDLSETPAQDPSLGLDLSADAAPVAEGPRILVIPPVRGGRIDARGYQRLMVALVPRLGARLVPAEETARAIRELKLSPAALQTPEGVARLAERVEAQRAVTFEVSRRDLNVRVYAPPEPEITASFQAERAAALSAKDAEKVAATLMERASDALTPAPTPAPEPEAPVVATGEPETPIVDQDLLEESAAIRKSATAPSGPARAPRVLLGVGGGADLRNFGMTGPATESVAPVETRTLPQVAVGLTLFPLQFLDPDAKASWSDAALEARFRRSLAGVRFQREDGTEGSCGLDDDELLLRGAWRYRLGGRLPSIGVGLGFSAERSEFDCPVPIVSTRYRALEASVRARQLLWGERLAIDALVGPRLLLTGPTADRTGTALMGELGVMLRLTPLFFTRVNARLVSTRLGQADRLDIDDMRTTLGLEMGVSL